MNSWIIREVCVLSPVFHFLPPPAYFLLSPRDIQIGLHNLKYDLKIEIDNLKQNFKLYNLK